LVEIHHWTFIQIGQLTFPQLAVLSGDSEKAQSKGITYEESITYEEMCKQVEEFRRQKGKT